MTRPIDQSAVLLPGGPRAPARPVPWVRIFFAVLYCGATACALVLLALAWRHELNRRHAAEAVVTTSGTALASARARVEELEEQNAQLGQRDERLKAALDKARNQSGRRGATLRSTRSVLRSLSGFVAALDGLDETAGDTLTAAGGLTEARSRLSTHVDALADYVRKTKEQEISKSVLRARLRTLAADLATLRTLVADLTTAAEGLDGASETLSETTTLDRALDSALAGIKKALAR